MTGYLICEPSSAPSDIHAGCEGLNCNQHGDQYGFPGLPIGYLLFSIEADEHGACCSMGSELYRLYGTGGGKILRQMVPFVDW